MRCENCGKTFESDWSDEEARAEARANWGELPAGDQAVICDDCYRRFRAWYRRMFGMELTPEGPRLIGEDS